MENERSHSSSFRATISHLEGTICCNMNASGNSKTVRETVINCVKALKLRSISTQHFIEFKCRRELYQKQLEEKGRHLGEESLAFFYKASMEDENLRFYIANGWIEASSIGKLTESQIKTSIGEKRKRKVAGEDLYLVDNAVQITINVGAHK